MADKLLKFLTDHNRPFAVNDMVQGLNQEMSKNKVQSVLNELVQQKKIIEKMYGKQKIYCVAQDSDVPANKVNETILEIDRESNGFALKLKEVEDELHKSTNELKNLEGTLTMEEATKMKDKLKEEIKELESNIESFAGKVYDKEEKELITKNYSSVLKEYNKRKRLCMDMVNAIFENYPKTNKHLMQELEIETDDDVNFKIKVN